ncbi:MAG TPA: hypothetical protein VFF76_05575 [Holophagaceae bacterium]|jgi:hypothetical protein|nr:hypothetical protein [Holophagaceae bacterium]
MRRTAAALLLLSCLATPLAAQSRRAPTAAQLKAGLKKLTAERDALQAKVDAQTALPAQLADAQRSRDQYKAQAAASAQELASLKAMLKENAGDSDALLKGVAKSKEQLAACQADRDKLAKENAELQRRLEGPFQPGDTVIEAENITPANPLNLYKVTPKLSGWGAPKGVVVVNVFVDDKGEVTVARLLQPLSGDSQKVKDANAACLDAAKRVVFDPARTKDGTPVKVWQGVGFYLD